jgi:hypothetical protein
MLPPVLEEGSKEEYRKTQAERMRSKNELIQAQIAQVRAKNLKPSASGIGFGN